MDKIWFDNYPPGAEKTIDVNQYESFVATQIFQHISIWEKF